MRLKERTSRSEERVAEQRRGSTSYPRAEERGLVGASQRHEVHCGQILSLALAVVEQRSAAKRLLGFRSKFRKASVEAERKGILSVE